MDRQNQAIAELKTQQWTKYAPSGSSTPELGKTPATNTPYNLGNVMDPITEFPQQARAPRVEFPTFEGVGSGDWIYKAEQYFLIDMTPDVWKVRLASMYLEGKALTWYHHYTQNHSSAQNIS